jgi:hypothetical protein
MCASLICHGPIQANPGTPWSVTQYPGLSGQGKSKAGVGDETLLDKPLSGEVWVKSAKQYTLQLVVWLTIDPCSSAQLCLPV